MAFVRQAGEKPRGNCFGGCIMPRVGLIRRLLTTQLLLRTRSIKCEKKRSYLVLTFSPATTHFTCTCNMLPTSVLLPRHILLFM